MSVVVLLVGVVVLVLVAHLDSNDENVGATEDEILAVVLEVGNLGGALAPSKRLLTILGSRPGITNSNC